MQKARAPPRKPADFLAEFRQSAALLRHWDVEKNGEPAETAVDLKRTRSWTCDGCPKCDVAHTTIASIHDRMKTVHSRKCKFCYPVSNSKSFCPCMSLANNPIPQSDVIELHPDVDATQVRAQSGRNVMWVCKGCEDCGQRHEFEARIGHMQNGMGCAACSHAYGRFCMCKSLLLYKPAIAAELDAVASGFTAEDVPYGSRKYGVFRCGKSCADCDAPHPPFTARVTTRTRDGGSSCPMCNKSGAGACPCRSVLRRYPLVAAEWSPKNELSPADVPGASHLRMLFVCSKNPGHGEWFATVQSRTYNNTGCPRCKRSKMEEVAAAHLEKLGIVPDICSRFACPDIHDAQKTLRLRVDTRFEYRGRTVVCELDGQQHFKPTSFGSRDDSDARFRRDVHRDLCKDAEIRRLRYHFLRVAYTCKDIPAQLDAFLAAIKRSVNGNGVRVEIFSHPEMYAARLLHPALTVDDAPESKSADEDDLADADNGEENENMCVAINEGDEEGSPRDDAVMGVPAEDDSMPQASALDVAMLPI
jgi:hypothetical protein